jgi:signal peptidase I
MGSDGKNSSPPGWLRRALIGRDPKRTLVRAALLAAACLSLFTFVLLPVKIDGISMEPTYKNGSINCVNRLAFLFHEPRRGDIVAIRTGSIAAVHTTRPKDVYLKRIIALPGETIGFHKGFAVINGKVLNEPYLRYPCDWEEPAEMLNPGEFYVVGDNRSMAAAGHTKGAARRYRILGKILL